MKPGKQKDIVVLEEGVLRHLAVRRQEIPGVLIRF